MGFWKRLFGLDSFNNKTVSSNTTEMIRYEWQQIEELVSIGGPSNLKQALIKADKTLDNALKDKFRGETMGERLKNARVTFDYQTYDNLWKAHKMRNSLVHESGFEPPHHMLTMAIENLKKGVTRLGVRI